MDRRLVVAIAALGLGGLLQACVLDSPTYITSREVPDSADAGGATSPQSSGGGSSASGDAGSATCSGDFAKPDLSKLTACGNGKGHCYDASKVAMSNQFTACSDATQVCVPDEILSAAGNKLKSCTSIIGPGGCVTASLIPQIAAQGGSALKQDACDSGQLCVPCADPTHNNAPTPFCQPIGVYQNACTASAASDAGAAADAAPMQGCCTTNGHSNGVCLPSSVVPQAQQGSTYQDTCAVGDKCLPAAFVNNQPVSCDAGWNGKGVCMDKCFNDMLGLAGDVGLLNGNGCGATELCVPCGWVSGQGVPGC